MEVLFYDSLNIYYNKFYMVNVFVFCFILYFGVKDGGRWMLRRLVGVCCCKIVYIGFVCVLVCIFIFDYRFCVFYGGVEVMWISKYFGKKL